MLYPSMNLPVLAPAITFERRPSAEQLRDLGMTDGELRPLTGGGDCGQVLGLGLDGDDVTHEKMSSYSVLGSVKDHTPS